MKQKMNFTRFKQALKQRWPGYKNVLLSTLSGILEIIGKMLGLYLCALAVGMGLTMGFFIIILYMQR